MGKNVHKKGNCGPHFDSLVYVFKVLYTHTHTHTHTYFNYGSYLKIVCIRLVPPHDTVSFLLNFYKLFENILLYGCIIFICIYVCVCVCIYI